MLVESEEALEEGIAMLENTQLDNVVAMDLEWRPDNAGCNNPVALIQLATPHACLLIRTRRFRRHESLPAILQTFLGYIRC